MHDLLRELSLKEAEKERFYIVAKLHGVTSITQRRIVISNTSREEDIDALQSMSLARSLIWDREEEPPSLNLRLLRIFESSWERGVEDTSQLVNLRHNTGRIVVHDDKSFSSLNRLWNLESFYVLTTKKFIFWAEIWCMSQIMHVFGTDVYLSDPPSGSQNDIVLGNLLTLRMRNFKCTEDVVKRIPNLKKLGLIYETVLDGSSCLNNLVCLDKLVSLNCTFYEKMPLRGPDSAQSVNFPQSLKKLSLIIQSSQCWEDLLDKIGTLPLLEKLTLWYGCFKEGEWETAEGHFQSLKYLEISGCSSLKQWTMESSHFPSLEHLALSELKELVEIPLDVADIPTLKSIELRYCRESAAKSARRIVEEQEESSGEAAIQVLVIVGEKKEAVETLVNHHNIRVQLGWE